MRNKTRTWIRFRKLRQSKSEAALPPEGVTETARAWQDNAGIWPRQVCGHEPGITLTSTPDDDGGGVQRDAYCTLAPGHDGRHQIHGRFSGSRTPADVEMTWGPAAPPAPAAKTPAPEREHA